MRDILEAQLLAKINLTSEDLEKSLRDVAQTVPQVLTKLDNLEVAIQQVGYQLNRLKGKLEDVLEMVTAIAGNVQQIKAMLEQLLQGKQFTPRPIYIVVLPGNPDELTPQKQEKIIALIQQASEDVSLEYLGTKKGSIVLFFEGSQQGYERLEQLFGSRQLSEILGITVEDVQDFTILSESVTKASLQQTSQRQVNLSQWLENVFEEGWKTIEQLFGQPEANLAFALRIREVEPENSDTTRNLIQLIYTSLNEQQRKQAAQRLGESRTGNFEVIAALIHLLHTTEDEETRWVAAESLWMIGPGNPAAGVRRVTDLGMQLAGHAVALMVAVLKTVDYNVDILIRVYPLGNKTFLPPKLQLIVLDEFNQTFLETQANQEDNYVQLKFGGSQKEQFSVRIILGDTEITEHFVI